MDSDGFSLASPPASGIQDGFNRKGLISDQGEKKKASSSCKRAYKREALGGD